MNSKPRISIFCLSGKVRNLGSLSWTSNILRKQSFQLTGDAYIQKGCEACIVLIRACIKPPIETKVVEIMRANFHTTYDKIICDFPPRKALLVYWRPGLYKCDLILQKTFFHFWLSVD